MRRYICLTGNKIRAHKEIALSFFSFIFIARKALTKFVVPSEVKTPKSIESFKRDHSCLKTLQYHNKLWESSGSDLHRGHTESTRNLLFTKFMK
ncbi:hypothetical protein V6Z12_D05G108600 [Gossypium hirsutum]